MSESSPFVFLVFFLSREKRPIRVNLSEGHNATRISGDIHALTFPPFLSVREIYSALAPHYSPHRRRLRSSPENYAEVLGNHVGIPQSSGAVAFHDSGNANALPLNISIAKRRTSRHYCSSHRYIRNCIFHERTLALWETSECKVVRCNIRLPRIIFYRKR